MERQALILCTENSARSQMAEALVNHDLAGRWHARSAGTQPADRVHPLAVRAMAEIGLDIADQVPKHISTVAGERFDSVITVCDNARRSCPAWLGPAVHVTHIEIPDPVLASGDDEQRLEAFRQARDAVRARIVEYLRQLE